MGYNATVVVMVDCLEDIAKDPNFGKDLRDAVIGLQLPPEHRSRYIRAGSCANAAEAIEMHHADGYAVVAVGGNTGVKLGECWHTPFPDTDANKLKLLGQLADELGYQLTKKPTKKEKD